MQSQSLNGPGARRAALSAVNAELLRIDQKISRLETVLRLLLQCGEDAGRQQVNNPTPPRVERRRAPC